MEKIKNRDAGVQPFVVQPRSPEDYRQMAIDQRGIRQAEKELKRENRAERVANAKAAAVGFAGGAVVAANSRFGKIKDAITGKVTEFKINREARRLEREANRDNNSNKRRLAVAAAVAVPLIALGTWGANHGWFNSGPAGKETANAAGNSMSTEELRRNLTVKSNEQNCIAVVKNTGGKTFNYNNSEYVKFQVASSEPVVADKESQDSRLWSDAVSNPIVEKDNKEGAQREINRAICEDPEVGIMVANAFARMETDGVKLVDLNPWLAAYNVDPTNAQNELNDKAAAFMPLEQNPGMDLQTALAKNGEYSQLAGKLVTLLSRFSNDGRKTFESKYNYELTDAGLTVGSFSEIGYSKDQYSADVNQFSITHKPGNGQGKDGECKMVIGFNVFDKRFVGGETNCEAPAPAEQPAQPTSEEPTATPEQPGFTPEQPQTWSEKKMYNPNEWAKPQIQGPGSGGTQGGAGTVQQTPSTSGGATYPSTSGSGSTPSNPATGTVTVPLNPPVEAPGQPTNPNGGGYVDPNSL